MRGGSDYQSGGGPDCLLIVLILLISADVIIHSGSDARGCPAGGVAAKVKKTRQEKDKAAKDNQGLPHGILSRTDHNQETIMGFA